MSWLLLWLVPKLVPLTVIDPPTGPAGGAKLLITGEMTAADELTATLSKPAVFREDVVELVMARPMYTFVAMLMVWVDPSCVQFTPSGAVYALNVFPLRINISHVGRPTELTAEEPAVPPVVTRYLK